MHPAPLVLLVAAFTSLAMTPLVIRVAVSRQLYDTPDATRRLHTQPVPRLGGVAVFVATVLGLVAALPFGMGGGALSPERLRFYTGVLLGGAVLFTAGLVDDLRGLRPSTKLAAQCLAALIVYLFGLQIQVVSLGPTAAVSLGWLSLPLTVLWVVGVTNAFNVIDNMDELATGIALAALTTVLVAALRLGNMDVALVGVALTGALLGFLRYNFNPARVFLGDSGSMFVGYMLAVLSVHGALKRATAVLVVVPLFALSVPLFDLSLSILRRWLRGVPIFVGDTRHISHRLLAIGLTQRRVVMLLSLVAGGFGLLGLLLAFTPPPALRGIAFTGGAISLLLLLYGMRRLNYCEFAESGAALASGLRRIRRILHDQIYAREVAQLIPRSDTLWQINAILDSKAREFGFHGMHVDRASALEGDGVAAATGRAARAWKLDYPVVPDDAEEGDPYVLRICCGSVSPRSARPHGAERVARILAPAILEWLLKTKTAETRPQCHPGGAVGREQHPFGCADHRP